VSKGISVLPDTVHSRYRVEEVRHACAVLAGDFPNELEDIIGCLEDFRLLRSEIMVGGGRKTNIADRFDDFLHKRGWKEESLTTSIEVADSSGTIIKKEELKSHKIDSMKGRIALEVQWNSKHGVYSRDLSAFRFFYELDALSVGVMITRTTRLQKIFDELQVGEKYGASTTHLGKLLPLVKRGDAGGCPILMLGISEGCYEDDVAAEQSLLENKLD
jgi:hypothetical protein